MKILSFLSRYRLLVNVMALALALGALAYSPTPAFANEPEICDVGCVSWDSVNGCTRAIACCVKAADDWTCVEFNL